MAGRVVLALLFSLAAATAGAQPAATVPCEQVASIGVATMTVDGTPGPIAEGTMSYKPGDPQYEEIKKHIGGKPGETKPVRPRC